MSKRTILTSLFFIFVFGIFAPSHRAVKAQAGGTCKCTVSAARTCGITESKCNPGYQAACTATITQCNGTEGTSCNCEPTTIQNCISAGSRCTSSGASCCSPYLCYQGFCTAGSPLQTITPVPGSNQTSGQTPSSVCDSLPQDQRDKCKSCGQDHVWTAIGCISATPSGFIQSILGFAIGIGGGVAFLLILFGGFQILTSAGNPEQLNAGREVVAAAITGLLLIVFSIFLLRFIGVNIFGIPGFG